ncbi:Uncharacterized protein QTN25_002071 [Entamoeba marina]
MTSSTDHNVCQKLLQHAVSLFLLPKHALVVNFIQSTRYALTIDEIVEGLVMPKGQVSECLLTLREYHFVVCTMVNKIQYYYIDYVSAIEKIIFIYQRIISQKTPTVNCQSIYECSSSTCDIKLTEKEVMDYYDDIDHCFICPRCDNLMHEVKEQEDLTNNIKQIKEVLTPIKYLLEQLKNEYTSVLDYPHYILPTKTPIEKELKRERYSKPIERIRQSIALPWEIDEIIKEVVDDSQNVDNNVYDGDSFSDIFKSREDKPEFIVKNKLFPIVVDSPYHKTGTVKNSPGQDVNSVKNSPKILFQKKKRPRFSSSPVLSTYY